MEIIYNITLKFSKDRVSLPLFRTVQGDNGSRKIRATLLNDDGSAFSPGSGVDVEYWSRKADGTGTSHSAEISGNVVTITLNEQDLACPGNVYAAICLVSGDSVLTAMPFVFENLRNAISDSITSTDDYRTIIRYASDTEAWAVGKRKGVDVPDTDPAYHNNAKYYYDRAQIIFHDITSFADGIVVVDDDEPTGEYNRIWVKETTDEVLVPTYDEFLDAESMIAPLYSDLTFPVSVGQHCVHDDKLYICNTAIASSEEWNASHWTQTTVDEEIDDIKGAVDEIDSDVSELKSDFTNLNLSDVNGLKTHGNKIPFAVEDYRANTYWYASTNPTELKRGTNSGYDTYKIKIDDPTGVIYFKNSPFTFIIDASGNILAGTNNTYATSYDLSALTNPAYICFTNHKGIASDPYVSENLIITKQHNKIITDKNNVPLSISQSITPSSPSLYPGSAWGNSVMQNIVVSLNFDIGEFSAFTLGFVDQSNTAQVKLNVSDTTLTYVLPGGSSVSDSHGLTFTNNIQMVVTVNDTDKIKINLTSNGVTFSKTWVFRNAGVWRPYTRIPDQTTTAKLSMEFLNINKPVWAFGDSYFSYDTTRWIYYLSQDGYQNNCLIDAFSGRNSTQAYASLNNLLKLGLPKYVFWCMGMNDGSDSASAPSTTWKTNIDKVIATCKQYDVTLILATIPTVPTVNNEQKNAFVRNSGYQYVDFAKAVGANSSGVWFSGMLSNDNVHPAVPGGIALYNRVLCDFPQITAK